MMAISTLIMRELQLWIKIQWIRIWQFKWIGIQGFVDQKLKKKNTAGIFFRSFFWPKIAIYLSLGLHIGHPSSGEAFSLQKRTSSTSKIKLFSMFVNYFCPPGSGSGLRMRIRIQGHHWIRIQSGYGSGSGSTTLATTNSYLRNTKYR